MKGKKGYYLANVYKKRGDGYSEARRVYDFQPHFKSCEQNVERDAAADAAQAKRDAEAKAARALLSWRKANPMPERSNDDEWFAWNEQFAKVWETLMKGDSQ